MTNYERITATPEALGAFLETLPIASGPWDVEFHRTFCKDCTAANCDGGNCPNNAQRNNPLWWLMQDGGRELPQGGPADKLGFLRDFLEGKTRWNFPEGTVFNVNTSTGDGAAVQLKPEADGEPEPPERPEPVVKLGPGASFRLENTPIHGRYPAPDGVKVDAVERLQNLCSFCKEMECYRSGDSMDAGRQYGLIKGRAWGIDVVMLEFAISVLSELREIKEVRIPAEPNTPGAWELMRDILAGKRPAPEGTVFDVVIDMAGNPQAIRSREEPEPAPRALTISMPGGTETVKLTSIAEAYGMADCIKKMAACVWPEAANEPAPGGA